MARMSNKLKWYKYHLSNRQDIEVARVKGPYLARIEHAHQEIASIEAELHSVQKLETRWSRFQYSWFGITSEFRRIELIPLYFKLRNANEALSRIQEELSDAVSRARSRGYEAYVVERRQRARKEEEAEREQRVRRLERSSSIRSAARTLKELLIGRLSTNSVGITCHYCGRPLGRDEYHLEHKKPISRGGSNKLDNLTIACPKCNLQKGKLTAEEFIERKRF